MKPRERVMASIDHREPDRVPIVVGGSAQKFSDPVLIKLMERFGIPKSKRKKIFCGFRFAYSCEELWQKLAIDSRYLYWHHERDFTFSIQQKGKEYVDSWGLDYDFSKETFQSAFRLQNKPLHEVSEDELNNYSWPEPDLSQSEANRLRELARGYLESGYFVAIYRPVVVGPYSIARFLRGDEKFYKDLIKNQGFVKALLEKVTEIQKKYYSVLLDKIGDLVQVVEIEDDLGGQEGPLINPEMYNKLIKPKHEELITCIKKSCQPVKVMLHSDGSIGEFIPYFIDAGIDIINPVQPHLKGMDLQELKDNFGSSIVFQGGIDTQKILSGKKPEEVKQEVKRIIDILAPGGGYLLGPSHNFTKDIPVENILAMFEVAREYGQY